MKINRRQFLIQEEKNAAQQLYTTCKMQTCFIALRGKAAVSAAVAIFIIHLN